MLNEEVARYRELSGDTTPNVPISRIGGYLDGYEKALEQEPKLEPCWETCFDCPLSHGCPKIKGCTNEQAIEYASKIPNDCPLFAQPERKPCEDAISREDALMALTGEWTEPTDELIHRFIKRIKNLPPVNTQVKTGHWKYYQNDKGDWVNECSVCGRDAGVGYQYPYCPWCAAKMSEPQERSE